MDSFDFHFDTDSIITNDTNSDSSDLDWAAFQSAASTIANSPFSPTRLSQQDDAVAPYTRSDIIATSQDDKIYFEIEHFFNGLNQQPQQEQRIIDSTHVNIHIPDQPRNDIHHSEPLHRTHWSSTVNERPTTYLPAPFIPHLSSTRSQSYHKLPEHAVKLMQEWYNDNLDDPYPRSPDKKRFITEGNITAQQCRSWFANRRQRFKHVKRSQTRLSSSRLYHSLQARLAQMSPIEDQSKTQEHYYYCEQQQQIASPLNPTTTLNVVINQQTVEQLIHNSLRKILYPSII